MIYLSEHKLRLTPFDQSLLAQTLIHRGMRGLYPKREIVSVYFDNQNLNMFRDSYSRYLPLSGSMLDKAKYFARFYASLRSERVDICASDKVMLLNFEDFILNYNESLSNLLSFTGISQSLHVSKFKYFDPSKSINSYQLYRKSITTDELKAIKYLERHLERYLYS